MRSSVIRSLPPKPKPVEAPATQRDLHEGRSNGSGLRSLTSEVTTLRALSTSKCRQKGRAWRVNRMESEGSLKRFELLGKFRTVELLKWNR
jgi:hypothetical protein